MPRSSRNDAPNHLKFDVSHLYEDMQYWKEDLESIREMLTSLKDYDGRVTENAAALFEVLSLVDSVKARFDRVNQFAHVQYMADATNAQFQSLVSGADTLGQEIRQVSVFVTPEITQLNPERFDALLSEDPRLFKYKNYVLTLFQGRDHRLSAAGEQILSRLAPSVSGPNRLYGNLMNADLQCKPIRLADGGEESVSVDSYLFKQCMSNDRNVRRDAYHSLLEGVKTYHYTLATNYLTHIQTQVALAKIRNYESAAQMFLEPAGIPTAFYHQALEVIMDAAKPIARRYVSLQKKLQGLDKVKFYDLTAPLASSDFRVTYDEGRALIETATKPLGQEYREFLQAAFDEHRIDLADNSGKFPIPVTMTCYGAPTYILSTWNDLLPDAMVLAHELGHLVHTDFTKRHNSFDAQYGMLLAETASTTNEWLMFHHFMESGDSATIQMVARHFIEFDFVQLIGMLFVIEKMQAEVYQKVENGEPISPADISKIQGKYLQEFYGEDFELDELAGLFWAVWPQPIYPTLYPYCYAAALCMSGQIVENIQDQGDTAVERYLEFLKSAGMKSAIDTYALVGIDMMDEMVLRKGIERFGQVLHELERALAVIN